MSLPYGPAMTALLEPLRSAFRVVNTHLAVPLVRRGGGPLLATPATGSILVLRTTGRTSGLMREAPLGYTVIDGRAVVVAGYGRGAHWFRNALAHPEVELALPGAVLAGRAEEITDPAQRIRAFRAVLGSMGVVGRLTLGDLAQRSDAEVAVLADAFPLLAITPTALLPGPFDPGGDGARANAALWLGLTGVGVVALARRALRPRGRG